MLVVAWLGGPAAPAAKAQVVVVVESYPATVVRVLDGDTLDARLADGRETTVRLIGIDTPERDECGAAQATAALRQLLEGQAVVLVSDPTQDAEDQFGRSLLYVDRSDGRDAGEEMLRGGWAEVAVFDARFERLRRYREADSEAKTFGRGVWSDCGGDFHRTKADELREKRLSAVAFIRRYYRRVSNRQFSTAWRMLTRRVRRDLGPFSRWKTGHRRSLGASVLSARARLSRGRAVLSIRLRARDRDACTGRVVRQHFRGRWLLAPRGDSWRAARVRMRKTRGPTPRISQADCPSPGRGGHEGEDGDGAGCQGYSPCLRPGSDVDCAGGDGNGPRYVSGPVSVTGSDPYDLDRDGDGVACED
jgi:endonuclease YncB( thermonuclease family)